jgi:hypothetical protein
VRPTSETMVNHMLAQWVRVWLPYLALFLLALPLHALSLHGARTAAGQEQQFSPCFMYCGLHTQDCCRAAVALPVLLMSRGCAHAQLPPCCPGQERGA